MEKEYSLNIGDLEKIEIFASDYYSKNHILIQRNEIYSFSVKEDDCWKDAYIKTNADGFFNPILFNRKKRVKNQKCFKLCGTIGKTEDDSHFAIGTNHLWTATKSGKLYFFANDHKNIKYYRNNKGSIILNVRRLSDKLNS